MLNSADKAKSEATVLGHPAGVPVIMALKVWEVFSYQGMRAFLVFYLIAAFALPDAKAAVLFASYAAVALATSVFGGAIADRWLGQREPTLVGAVLIMAGHATLALQHLFTGLDLLGGPLVFQVFCAGLGLIAVGTGLLKPNVLTIIGGLYRSDDPKREVGYYLYYMGVNLGSFTAPLVCGWVAQTYGWNWGFSLAAMGMAIGLTVLIRGRRLLRRQDEGAAPNQRRAPPRLLIYGAVAVAVVLAAVLIQHGLILGALLAVTMTAGCGYLLVIVARDKTGADRAAVLRLFCVLPVPALFVILFEQFSLVINLFADRLVDRGVAGLTVAASQLLSLNALFVLVLLPLLTLVWSRLRAAGREPDMPGKFSIGFFCMAAGFAVLALAVRLQTPGVPIGMAWVVACYLLITLGEIMIAPLSYALIGRTVPRHLEGISMGLLLLSFAIGNLCAGGLATLAAAPAGASSAQMADIYGRFFLLAAGIGLAASVASFGLRGVMRPARP